MTPSFLSLGCMAIKTGFNAKYCGQGPSALIYVKRPARYGPGGKTAPILPNQPGLLMQVA